MTTINDETETTSKGNVAGSVLGFIGLFAILGFLLMGAMMLNAAAHPYTGTGTIKSHIPFGSALCNITVVEDKGDEHTYQRSGGLPYCAGITDGSTVEIEDGMIKTITAP